MPSDDEAEAYLKTLSTDDLIAMFAIELDCRGSREGSPGMGMQTFTLPSGHSVTIEY